MGSYSCRECDVNCDGCHGKGGEKCIKCNKGFVLNEHSGYCRDVDECKETTDACPKTMNCVNNFGGFDCMGNYYWSSLLKYFALN